MSCADQLARIYFGGDGAILKRTDAIEIGRELALASYRDGFAACLALLTNDEIVDVVARSLFEQVEQSIAEDCGLSARTWKEIDVWERNQELKEARAALRAAADAIDSGEGA